jgi:hypothetical protein
MPIRRYVSSWRRESCCAAGAKYLPGRVNCRVRTPGRAGTPDKRRSALRRPRSIYSTIRAGGKRLLLHVLHVHRSIPQVKPADQRSDQVDPQHYGQGVSR